MNRFDSKSRKDERKKIDDVAQQPTLTTIETGKTLTKLLAGKPYDKEDIIACAKILLPKYDLNFDQQFKLFESVQDLDIAFEEITKVVFVAFAKPKNRWILFCVIRDENGKSKVLYKDPCGAVVPFRLEKKLKGQLSDVEFIAQTRQDQDEDKDAYYGPLCVRNLKIMLDLLKQDFDSFIQKFPEVTFAHSIELNHDKFTKVVQLTDELGENDEFKVALKEFVDKLPLDLGSGMLDYKRVLEEELEKDEEHVDMEKVRRAREKYLNQESIKTFQDNYKLNEKAPDEKTKDYELDIQKKFPDEMKKLGDIFEVLDDLKVDKQLFAALENISEILDIDYDKMKSFYEFKLKKEDTSVEEKLSPDDISDIAKQLPVMKEASISDGTPFEDLLAQVTLGMDQEGGLPSPQDQQDLSSLRSKYNSVKSRYENWKNTDIQSIHTWASKIKGHLGNKDDDVCEVLAIMDRALNLLTGGHRLRDTQILAALIFFHGQNNQGRLCQIKTGEGKTIIVSLLAVIRALQGYTVDVITSNPLLAADGVDETKTFYSAFNLTVSTNNVAEAGKNDFKIGYSADVLYGTISNFQFDYLKDSFEGFNIRKERRFGQVILDEVDSMLVDNGGHIAKLASPYPGMEGLRYIYIKIWQQLYKAEQSFVKETQDKLQEFLSQYPDPTEAKLRYGKYLQEMIKSERSIIKEKIRASNPTNVPLIPVHLQGYVRDKLEVWIKNALHAKYNCHEHQQYRIITNDTGEKVITPVDYLNTGVTLKNTIWSNGLHQFVQLKHNLYLTFESLTSSFISNIGYIKNYEDKNIFGLTGTLGSKAEQVLLSHIYNINYAKLPTYKQKKFEEIPGMILDDGFWANEVALEVMEKIDEGRAVLVICETEQDLMTVKSNLEILHSDDFRIRLYANEDNAEETEDKVKIGDIILATNIAGRGTNFRTEKDLEANGGLHVCVGFLPCNLRVEGQAFGRTSRQGNNGTAQLIIRRSEVVELDIQETNPSFAKIKQERDRLERQRLQQINDVLVKELNFKDELFGHFSDFHRELKQRKISRGFMFVLQDLKEFWAFWLERKNFKASSIANTTPKREFDSFINEAQTIINGKISHNPFYCISLADYYLENNDRMMAGMTLQQAIKMGGSENYELLAGAHLKLFEIAIHSGEQVMERFRKAIAKVFFIDVSKNETYKQVALEQLKHAQVALGKEIGYIEKYLMMDEETENPDFEMIVTNDKPNLLLKHIYSRLYCLKIHSGNIKELIATLQKPEGVDIGGKAETTLDNFAKMSQNPDLKNVLTFCELTELQSIGVDSIYCLKEIHDVPDVVIHAAQGQILAGIAALAVGLCFFPVFPIMSTIAGTLISEGIMDIVMQLLTQGSSEFDDKDFMKGKFMSYGISLLTFGVSAITQSVKILSKAVSFCRKLSSFLRRSKYLKGLCNTLANMVDRLGNYLEKLLVAAKFNKLSKAEQLDKLTKLQKSGHVDFEKLGGLKKLTELQKVAKLTRTDLLVNFVKDVMVSTTTGIVKSIVEEHVIKPLLKLVFEELIEKIKEGFKKSLEKSIRKRASLMEKLKTSSKEKITEAVDAFMETNEVEDTAKEVGFELLGKLNSPVVDALTVAYDTFKSVAEFERYHHKFASYLDQVLQGGDCDNNVDEIIEEMCDKLTDQMFSLCLDMCKGYLTGVKNTIGIVLDKNLKLKHPEDKKESIVLSTSKKTDKSNPYSLLGLDSNASLSEVRKQYRKQALLIHPDKNRHDPLAKAKFQELQNAYDDIVKSHN